MAEEEGWGWPPSPTGSPMYLTKDDHWTHFDNSVNAVSFGFVATAILISMFLIMAIFERFLRPPSPPELTPSVGHRRHADIESQLGFNHKLGYPTTKVSTNAREVSVLMPGNDIPTFIAHPAPAPAPCQPERNPWPSHQQNPIPSVINSNSNVSS
ncbi:hypothetical protein KY290_016027 [Solanum tuberosum]|uniref:Uncharacterized protein n=1 Tax=Solanum tuberosum TaxID=4113 RepID=A0ABQ7VU53_SOLTU|nr:hypothetical protein KY289_014632 [Solanum tuberosum]KAH0699775.1 hypothetical protein KY284_013990 [Solanum tuberosum]KAH0772046.1 hypothetical protein KY290_016027 [Solanum tuberosum]